jgi:hypothetical protein
MIGPAARFITLAIEAMGYSPIGVATEESGTIR